LRRLSRVPTQDPRSRLFPGTFTAADLMRVEFPPVRWAVPGILPEGATLLAGAPKMGKSWLALGLALAVASGGVALGTRPVEQGDVLYLALEDTDKRLQKRMKQVLDGSEAPGRLRMNLEWPTIDDGGADRLGDWLAVHDARLVVVDVLKRVRPDVSAKKSVYDADYEALAAIKSVADEHATAVLVLHHTRKQAAEDPLDEVSGSRGLSGAADNILVLKRDRGRADAYLHVTGRDIEEEAELALTWDANLGSWSLAGAAEEYRLSEERRGVIDALKRAESPMSPKDLSEVLDKSQGAVKMLLGEMVRAGQVSNPSRGKYGLPGSPYLTDSADYGSANGLESKESKRSKGSPESIHARPVSLDLEPGQSATVAELAARRDVGAAGEETRRSGSGPARALASYLEDPGEQSLERLARAILTARRMDPGGWRDFAPAVEAAAGDPANHPLDCGCGYCS
jgi:hypothetical protein